MFVIRTEFLQLCDVPLGEVYDETGVYVLWSSKAAVRPSYVGEGNVLKRFVDHMRKPWAARPLHGTIAFMRDRTRSLSKDNAKLVEAALLHVAMRIDRFPPNNAVAGQAGGALHRLLRRQDHNARMVRIVVSGRDPLLPPERPVMRSDKQIVFREHREGWMLVEHDWNRRAA